MELAVIKSILNKHKAKLEGKKLMFGGDLFENYENYIKAIEKNSNKEGFAYSMVLTLNDVERCVSAEHALEYCFQNEKYERFDTVKIFRFQKREKVNLPEGVTMRNLLEQVPSMFFRAN